MRIMKNGKEGIKNEIVTAVQEQFKTEIDEIKASPTETKERVNNKMAEELKITQNTVEEEVEYVKESSEKEIMDVKTDLERIKTHGTTISHRTGSNKINIPTYDGQTPFETYRL